MTSTRRDFLIERFHFRKCRFIYVTLILVGFLIISTNGSGEESIDEFSSNNDENQDQYQDQDQDHITTNFPSSFLKKDHLNKLGNKSPCQCGLKGIKDVKIVGGMLSKQHCWPWVAAIVSRKGKKVVCGSSVIGTKHILTAAHCVDYIQEQGFSKFQVILGTNNLKDKDAVVRNISSADSHPMFDEQSLDYDVGVVELSAPVVFSQKSILPICLTPQKGVPYVNKTGIVAGWGSTKFGGATTTMQMQVMLDVNSNSDCQAAYKNETEVTTRMMCASKSNKDSCQGDSGGPLFIKKDGTTDRYLQIGIVSFGKGCGDKRYPGIYGRVSRFTKWIRRKVGNDNGCNNL